MLSAEVRKTARILAVRAAFLTRRFEAAEIQIAKAEDLSEWLCGNGTDSDTRIRCRCLEEALATRAGGSTLEGLTNLAKAVYSFAQAVPAGTPTAVAPERVSREGRPRGVRTGG